MRTRRLLSRQMGPAVPSYYDHYLIDNAHAIFQCAGWGGNINQSDASGRERAYGRRAIPARQAHRRAGCSCGAYSKKDQSSAPAA